MSEIEVKALEWREDWGGSLDDIPEWRAKTPWGSVTVSVAGYRDENGRPYERHSDVPEELKTRLIAERQSDYEARIRSALVEKPAVFASRYDEALGECVPVEVDPPMLAKLRERVAVERKAEPVAWRYWDDEDKTWMLADVCVPDGADIIEPLYSTPPAAPVRGMREALEAMLEMYGPPSTVAEQCTYPDGHPITKARAALSASPSPVDSRDARTSGFMVAFERDYPELYWHVAKGKVRAGEPLYGAIITLTGGAEIGHGESDVSAEAAFEAAFVNSGLPVPPSYAAPSKAEVRHALEVLCRANGADLDEWTGGVLPCDEIEEALKAASKEQQP